MHDKKESRMAKHRLYVCPRCCERTLAFVEVPRAEWLRHKYRQHAAYRERRLHAKRVQAPPCRRREVWRP